MEDLQQPASQITLQNVSVLNNEDIISVVDGMARDMKFYSLFYIIYGGFISLTIIGALLGIPMIIYNLKLRDSAKQYGKFVRRKDFYELKKAFENQKKFFFFNKILILIGLIGIFLYILVLIFFGWSLFIAPSGDFSQI